MVELVVLVVQVDQEVLVVETVLQLQEDLHQVLLLVSQFLQHLLILQLLQLLVVLVGLQQL